MVINEGQPSQGCWPHAKAEFFAAGIGWVPADVAGAIRMNRATDGLECFGNDSAELLTPRRKKSRDSAGVTVKATRSEAIMARM